MEELKITVGQNYEAELISISKTVRKFGTHTFLKDGPASALDQFKFVSAYRRDDLQKLIIGK